MGLLITLQVEPNLLSDYQPQLENELAKAMAIPAEQQNKTLISHLTPLYSTSISQLSGGCALFWKITRFLSTSFGPSRGKERSSCLWLGKERNIVTPSLSQPIPPQRQNTFL